MRPEKWQKLDSHCSSWFLACSQFSDSVELIVNSSFRRIQNSKFKIQNLIRGECLRKKWQKLEKPYSSWVLACCQFQDSVELIQMKILLAILVVFVTLLVILEVGLRLVFGLGNPLIYIADEKIGYLLAPNQEVKRLGNKITINQYSMRSNPIAPEKPDFTLRILLLGDSLANGGWWTAQDEIISNLIQAKLSSKLNTNVEVLNASANSWGPHNELAYLQRFGTFQSQVIVLLLNTDDLFAKAPTSGPVGRDRNYPDRKPNSALGEIYQYYFQTRKAKPKTAKVKAEKSAEPKGYQKDPVGFNLAAIEEIKAIATSQKAKLILALTPLKRELAETGPRDYELKARMGLTQFTETESIPYLDFLPLFQVVEDPRKLYRDHIHLNNLGNELVSETIFQSLQQLITTY